MRTKVTKSKEIKKRKGADASKSLSRSLLSPVPRLQLTVVWSWERHNTTHSLTPKTWNLHLDLVLSFERKSPFSPLSLFWRTVLSLTLDSLALRLSSTFPFIRPFSLLPSVLWTSGSQFRSFPLGASSFYERQMLCPSHSVFYTIKWTEHEARVLVREKGNRDIQERIKREGRKTHRCVFDVYTLHLTDRLS